MIFFIRVQGDPINGQTERCACTIVFVREIKPSNLTPVGETRPGRSNGLPPLVARLPLGYFVVARALRGQRHLRCSSLQPEVYILRDAHRNCIIKICYFLYFKFSFVALKLFL
jgi:hypothetical protein